MKVRKQSGMVINLLLIILILGLYFITSQSDSASVMASLQYTPTYRGKSQGENQVALQFTVTWNAASLEPLLDTMKENDVKATFAVTGKWALENPALLMRMQSEGHEIATMGYDAQFDGKLNAVTEDIEKSLTVIEEKCGYRPSIYYSGDRNVSVSGRAAKKLDLRHVLCTVDLQCARGTADDIIARALQDPIDGSIILMQPTAAAAEAMQGLIDAMKQKGIRIVRTRDVINDAS